MYAMFEVCTCDIFVKRAAVRSRMIPGQKAQLASSNQLFFSGEISSDIPIFGDRCMEFAENCFSKFGVLFVLRVFGLYQCYLHHHPDHMAE